ncbi:MAG: dihydrodipicolinate synthase family protein [Gaiellales bacterium]
MQGLLPPIPTPFLDGRIDVRSLHAMLDKIEPHVDGVLVGGSVGETPSLTIEERIALIGEVARQLDRVSGLAASIADNSIEHTRRLAAAAVEHGAGLLVLSCPNYFANDLAALIDYFGAVAAFSDAELCLYDNPVASHTLLSVDDVVALVAAVPQITHVKVTDLAHGKVAALRARSALVIHAGDDAVLWHQLTTGADGAMVAMPLVYPEQMRRLFDDIAAGDMASARELLAPIARFVHVSLGAPDYPAVIKAVLHERGVIASDELRLPLRRLDAGRRAEVMASL